MFKDKNSKFFGYAFPITSEEEAKRHITHIKKQHRAARHWCYAWQLGVEDMRYRINDDGEPSNSAGKPIYGQIQSFELTNILIVVVRYFGGVKLGVGGLINAYRAAARLALENSKIVEKTIKHRYKISFQYKDMNKVMRIIKENQIQITDQILELKCELFILINKNDSYKIKNLFVALYEVEIKLLSS